MAWRAVMWAVLILTALPVVLLVAVEILAARKPKGGYASEQEMTEHRLRDHHGFDPRPKGRGLVSAGPAVPSRIVSTGRP